MRILTACALMIFAYVGCANIEAFGHRLRSDIIVKVEGQTGGQIDQVTIDKAWAEAIKVFGGDLNWKCPVTPDRVIYVPSPLRLSDTQYYGITVSHPEVVNGKIVLVEVIEIHLPPEQICAIYTVLVHEMGHCILDRREVSDPTYQKAAEKYKSQEEMVKGLWPAMKINGLVCK